MAIVLGCSVVGSVLSFSLPAFVVYLCINSLAGKETIVSAEVPRLAAEILGGGSAMVVVIAVLFKGHRQKGELRRLRARLKRFESGEFESRSRQDSESPV